MSNIIAVATLEAAAEAEYVPSTAASAGLTPFVDGSGQQLAVNSNGCVGSAWRDASGDVIVAFQGTTSSAQTLADAKILIGSIAPAITAAQAFASQVETSAAQQGIGSGSVFVTGHSLGGVLAEAAAEGTGLGGASFAGAGLPGYAAPSGGPAGNFVSFVEAADPFANYASDGGEGALVGASQNHYGRVVTLGGSSPLPAAIVTEARGLYTAFLHGQLPAATAAIQATWATGMAIAHGLSIYQQAIAQLPPSSQLIGAMNATPAAAAAVATTAARTDLVSHVGGHVPLAASFGN